MSSIRISIPKPSKGPVKVEVIDGDGPSCLALTEGIQKALGWQVIDCEITEDYSKGG